MSDIESVLTEDDLIELQRIRNAMRKLRDSIGDRLPQRDAHSLDQSIYHEMVWNVCKLNGTEKRMHEGMIEERQRTNQL